MKKFKITKGNRVYIVDAKSHIDAISKVKAVKDSSIKDYSPEVIKQSKRSRYYRS